MKPRPYTIVENITLEKSDTPIERENKQVSAMAQILKNEKPHTERELRGRLGDMGISSFHILKNDYIKANKELREKIQLDQDSNKWFSRDNPNKNYGLDDTPSVGTLDQRRIEKIYAYLNEHGETTLSDLCSVAGGMSEQTMRNLRHYISEDTFWNDKFLYSKTKFTLTAVTIPVGN